MLCIIREHLKSGIGFGSQSTIREVCHEPSKLLLYFRRALKAMEDKNKMSQSIDPVDSTKDNGHGNSFPGSFQLHLNAISY